MANTNLQKSNFTAVQSTLGTDIRDEATLRSFLNNYQDKAICVFPKAIGKASPGYSLGVTLINVDTNLTKENKENNADCYLKQGRVLLHYSKLNEIAKAAGLNFGDYEIELEDRDQNGKLLRVIIKQRWSMIGIDGRELASSSIGTYDYEVEKETKTYDFEKRRAKGFQLAHTNAKYRAINDAIGELPRSFELSELVEKPLLVPCLKTDVNAMLQSVSPENRSAFTDAIVAKQLGIVNMMYPASGEQRTKLTPSQEVVNQLPAAETEYPEAQEAQVEEVAEEPAEQAPVNDGSMIYEDADFIAASHETEDPIIRARFVLNLINKKNYKPQNPATIENLAKSNFTKILKPLIVKLLQMPDYKDDLPY